MVKDKGVDTCYSATYMSQTCDQRRFTISEVAADWQRVMFRVIIMFCTCFKCLSCMLCDPSIFHDSARLVIHRF